jgi:hypothetical protein
MTNHKMLAADVGGKELAKAIVDGVSDATDETADDDSTDSDKEKPKAEDKLDNKAELFARRIIDGVTKNLAEIMKPKPAEEEDDGNDKPAKKRKPTSKPADKPKSKSLLDRLLG